MSHEKNGFFSSSSPQGLVWLLYCNGRRILKPAQKGPFLLFSRAQTIFERGEREIDHVWS